MVVVTVTVVVEVTSAVEREGCSFFAPDERGETAIVVGEEEEEEEEPAAELATQMLPMMTTRAGRRGVEWESGLTRKGRKGSATSQW